MSERLLAEARKEFCGFWKIILISLVAGMLFGFSFRYIIPHLWGELPVQKKASLQNS